MCSLRTAKLLALTNWAAVEAPRTVVVVAVAAAVAAVVAPRVPMLEWSMAQTLVAAAVVVWKQER